MSRVGKNIDPDTRLGGKARSFPSTHTGLVLDLGTGVPQRRRRALDDLSRRYWKPVYRYIRLSWSKSNEDAKDLTQAFFLWLLEGGALGSYDPDRGPFRPFLKLVLRRFLGHREEARFRLKQGGDRILVPLDDETLTGPAGADPERAFDRAWAVEVARAALARVRRRLSRDGWGVKVEAYEAFDLRPLPERPTYAGIAARLGVSEHDVRNYLRDVRERVRREIRTELAESVGDPGDLEAEWNELFSA